MAWTSVVMILTCQEEHGHGMSMCIPLNLLFSACAATGMCLGILLTKSKADRQGILSQQTFLTMQVTFFCLLMKCGLWTNLNQTPNTCGPSLFLIIQGYSGCFCSDILNKQICVPRRNVINMGMGIAARQAWWAWRADNMSSVYDRGWEGQEET